MHQYGENSDGDTSNTSLNTKYRIFLQLYGKIITNSKMGLFLSNQNPRFELQEYTRYCKRWNLYSTQERNGGKKKKPRYQN